MSAKILEHLSRKLKQGQIIIDVLPVHSPSKGDKRNELSLAVCSLTLYLLDGTHLKRAVPTDTVRQLTLSSFSNELILHCGDQDLWLQSCHTVKLIKHIFKIREKFFQDTCPLLVALERERSLQHFAAEESKLRKFWQGVFGKKQSQEGSIERRSLVTLEVRQRDFVMLIGRAIYRANYKNVELLYISGSNGFIFNEFDHTKEVLDQQTTIYQHKQTKEYFLMRRILRSDDEQGKILRKSLENYKLEDYNEQVLFAVETAKYYQVITPYSTEQRTLQQLLTEEKQVQQIDMVSIFYKLMSFIKSSLHTVSSLAPEYIIVKQTITLSSVFCINNHRTNLNYLAPEELDTTFAKDTETTNLWKIGILLYQTAFLALPFPIEYLAEIVANKKPLILKFPNRHSRSQAFLQFLQCVLVIDPEKRGGGHGWQKTLFSHRWILQCMR